MQISIQKAVTNFNINNPSETAPQTTPYGSPSVNIWFPYDLTQGDNNPAFIFFEFFKYSRPSIYNPPTLDPLGTVSLPLPIDLVDRISLTYDQQGSSAAIGAALDSFSTQAGTGVAGTFSAIVSHIPTVGEGIGLDAGEGILKFIPGLGGQNLVDKGLQFLGLAQNPFLSILFNAPQFKRFGMTWTFIPENPQDSVNLDYIVRKFKYHSLPDISGGGLFLTYPDIVVPTIFPQNYFFNFKQCVLENVIVNYAPGATPAIYSGTYAPTAVQFSISLLEIALWYKGDMQAQGSGAGTPQSFTSNSQVGVTPGAGQTNTVTGSPTYQYPPSSSFPGGLPNIPNNGSIGGGGNQGDFGFSLKRNPNGDTPP